MDSYPQDYPHKLWIDRFVTILIIKLAVQTAGAQLPPPRAWPLNGGVLTQICAIGRVRADAASSHEGWASDLTHFDASGRAFLMRPASGVSVQKHAQALIRSRDFF